MKQTRIHVIGSIALAALLASCASLEKMKKGASSIQYKVTPEVLEAHAGKVALAIKGNVPAKLWDKKCTAVITPVLVYEGGETVYPSITVQGESVTGNNPSISYLNGGQINYAQQTVDFNDKMRVSDLVIRIKATKGTESVTFDDYKIAEGVIATSTLLGEEKPKAVKGKDDFKKLVNEAQAAEIIYLIQKADIRNGELKKEDVKARLHRSSQGRRQQEPQGRGGFGIRIARRCNRPQYQPFFEPRKERKQVYQRTAQES